MSDGWNFPPYGDFNGDEFGAWLLALIIALAIAYFIIHSNGAIKP